ncbi:MAG: flocculation-associated PEP-CTERM protein PepA [Propionivibrio sp.]|uniref:flocculation-associated PEP-CTERM protein PepA n=1 Tax=Propionivibrio sp. TaxID=2212460 RepID=UPI001A4FFE57|nr:flocculation-associated PEP-CTERM protein PepA [Propionivibrio sp.]MBL8414819.1 flocculation-associated PEP-CTERM protein PepA [Propionivibrio sp.]
MKSFNKLAVAISAVGLLTTAAPTFATPVLTFTTANYGVQSLDVFGGFDWNSAASAVTTGFTGTTGDITTTTYWANAVSIQNPSGGNFLTPGISPAAPLSGPTQGWEFTVKSTITEIVTCVDVLCTQANFSTLGGVFDIYYQDLADANLLTGAGITNGTKVFSGAINPGFAGTFTNVGAGGIGIFNFTGNLSYVNAAFVDTSLLNTTAVSTLQIGSFTTAWAAPSNLPGAGGASGAAISPDDLVFQADGNQKFNRIPEPGTMALLGLSLVGLGFARRRKD